MDENKIKFLKTVNRDQIINPDKLEIAASKVCIIFVVKHQYDDSLTLMYEGAKFSGNED